MPLKHNRLAQIILLIALLVAFGFWLLASRPPARPFGRYDAKLDVPQPVYGIHGEIVAYVTVSNAAVVTPPIEWKLPDLICMTVQLARNADATSPDTEDVGEQAEWDKKYQDWLIFDEVSIRSTAREGSRLKLAAQLLADYVPTYEKVSLKFYGVEPIILEKNQNAISLLCYYHYFLQNDVDVPNLPVYHELALKGRNAAVYAYPAYHFRIDSPPQATDAPGAVDLARLSLHEYLQNISKVAPAVIQPLRTGR